jgi:hypothetical protein
VPRRIHPGTKPAFRGQNARGYFSGIGPSRATIGSDGTGNPEPHPSGYRHSFPGASLSRIRLTRIRSAPGVESNISARAS